VGPRGWPSNEPQACSLHQGWAVHLAAGLCDPLCRW